MMVNPRISRKPAGAYHHGDLRRALLDSALELARTRGPAGFTLAEICRTAGVSQAAPYRHFESKEHILAVAAREGFTRLTEAIRAAIGEPAGFGNLVERLARGYLCFAREFPAHLTVMFTHTTGEHYKGALGDPCKAGPDGLAHLPPPANRTEEALLDSWRAGQESFLAFALALVEAARGSPLEARVVNEDGRPFAAACWAMMHGVAVLWLEHMIPSEWERDDFMMVGDWIVRPWLAGMQISASD